MDAPYWRVPQGTEWCRSDGYGSRMMEGTEDAPEGARLVTVVACAPASIVETAGSLAGRGHRRLAGYALRRLAAQVEHDAQPPRERTSGSGSCGTRSRSSQPPGLASAAG
jgi:hypothetical protein